jgi:fibronectin type 3 domain-containing protein
MLMGSSPSRLLLAICATVCLTLACCHKAQPHRVTLAWQAPPPAPGVSVVGYNVYRSTTSYGPFVKLATRVPGPPYEDRLVVSGRTYFYVVTALDQAGRESRFSSEVRATIP